MKMRMNVMIKTTMITRRNMVKADERDKDECDNENVCDSDDERASEYDCDNEDDGYHEKYCCFSAPSKNP